MQPDRIEGKHVGGGSRRGLRLHSASFPFHAKVSKVPVPWIHEAQQPPMSVPDGAPRLDALLVDERSHPITSPGAWEQRRAQIRREWLEFLGPMNVPRTSPRFEVRSEHQSEGVLRQLIRYEVEPGIGTEAYLLRPTRTSGPRPGIAVFHSTVRYTIRQPAGLKGPREKALGLELCERGFTIICPRCFLWSSGRWSSYHAEVNRFQARHPGIKGMAKMLHDAQVALDILAGLPEVDPQRLGAAGHSLGAKITLYLAAFDDRVRVAAASEGGIGIGFTNWDAPWYLGDAIRRIGFAREHHELLALIAPRAFLLIGGDSADGDRSWPFVEAVAPVYHLLGVQPLIGLLNHKKGHTVPPEAAQRIYEWFGGLLGN